MWKYLGSYVAVADNVKVKYVQKKCCYCYVGLGSIVI